MYRNEKVAPLIDALNELGMPLMAATLDGLYRSKNFLEMDHLSLLTAMIEPEYDEETEQPAETRRTYQFSRPDQRLYGFRGTRILSDRDHGIAGRDVIYP